jgi:hypothetical protein
MKNLLKQWNIVNKLLNKENKIILIAILSILLLIFIILYLIPDLKSLLYGTILGNLILFSITILVLFNNIKFGILLIICLLITYSYIQLSINYKGNNIYNHLKEGFIWDHKATQDYLILQNNIFFISITIIMIYQLMSLKLMKFLVQ